MLVFQHLDLENKFNLHVYRFSDNFSESPDTFLSRDEINYFNSLTSSKRQNEYLQARFVLKTHLAKKLNCVPTDIEFTKTGEGKPVLANFTVSLDFNISHSHDFFAIVISEVGQVGVDIEKRSLPQHLTEIARKYFSDEEIKTLLAQPTLEAKSQVFTRLWSGKEALIKAAGSGVFKSVHDVLLNINNWSIQKLPQDFGESSRWELYFFEQIEDYTCSVAVKF